MYFLYCTLFYSIKKLFSFLQCRLLTFLKNNMSAIHYNMLFLFAIIITIQKTLSKTHGNIVIHILNISVKNSSLLKIKILQPSKGVKYFIQNMCIHISFHKDNSFGILASLVKHNWEKCCMNFKHVYIKVWITLNWNICLFICIIFRYILAIFIEIFNQISSCNLKFKLMSLIYYPYLL